MRTIKYILISLTYSLLLSANAQVPEGYVDLGLSVYWKAKNEWNWTDDHGFYNYDDAKNRFGSQLPSLAQLDELNEQCTWTWIGTGYKLTGPNGNSIELPTTGFRYCLSGIESRGGYYWSSTPIGDKSACALIFDTSGGHYINTQPRRCTGYAVRLVHAK